MSIYLIDCSTKTATSERLLDENATSERLLDGNALLLARNKQFFMPRPIKYQSNTERRAAYLASQSKYWHSVKHV